MALSARSTRTLRHKDYCGGGVGVARVAISQPLHSGTNLSRGGWEAIFSINSSRCLTFPTFPTFFFNIGKSNRKGRYRVGHIQLTGEGYESWLGRLGRLGMPFQRFDIIIVLPSQPPTLRLGRRLGRCVQTVTTQTCPRSASGNTRKARSDNGRACTLLPWPRSGDPPDTS